MLSFFENLALSCNITSTNLSVFLHPARASSTLSRVSDLLKHCSATAYFGEWGSFSFLITALASFTLTAGAYIPSMAALVTKQGHAVLAWGPDPVCGRVGGASAR